MTRTKYLILSIMLSVASPGILKAQGAERFSLDTLESGIILLEDSSQQEIVLPLFLGQGEMTLFGTYHLDEDNKALINF